MKNFAGLLPLPSQLGPITYFFKFLQTFTPLCLARHCRVAILRMNFRVATRWIAVGRIKWQYSACGSVCRINASAHSARFRIPRAGNPARIPLPLTNLKMKGTSNMSRMKSVFAITLLVAVAGIVPQAHAANRATIKLMVAGSSALWQAMALGAYQYNGTAGNCPTGAVKPCYHYTSGSNFNLTDTRPKTYGGAPSNVVDNGQIWIIWDSHTTANGTVGTFQTPNVWAFVRVDTAVGDRCYFAHPRCNVAVPVTNTWPAPGAGINSALWGSDTDPNNCGGTCNGGSVVTAFEAAAGVLVNSAASDIRPEDALWATCRANSNLGLPQGLGYNTAIPAGRCPTASTPKADLLGTAIVSQVNTNHTATPVAWNISGTDPYSGTSIPPFSTVNIGAEPLVFIGAINHGGSLTTVDDVTDSGVQAVFSGTTCNATALGASSGDPLTVYLREALSGTMNTMEYTVFAYPDFSGKSQETGIDPSLAADNPLNNACAGGGGTRKRGVGTGDVVTGVYNDGQATTTDAISYTFFSYGNITNGTKSINDSAKYKYFTLNGVDPLFHKYVHTAGQAFKDPGQPNASVGEIPGPADNATCPGIGFPCPENVIWNGGLSFPNIRNGAYRAWSLMRFVADGAALAAAKTLLASAQTVAASTTPDFVPYAPVLAKPTANPPIPPDPGLTLLRSHYQQIDNNGVHLGAAPLNDSTTGQDKGGDVGGCIEHQVPGAIRTLAIVHQTDNTINLVENPVGSECAIFSSH